jgi:glycosyltransferase involved in cell wall biosynthesis
MVSSVPESGINATSGSYVAYVGRFSIEKGINTLLDSARQTELPIRFAGDYSAMHGLVRSAPKNAKFLGRMDRYQLAEFYQKARFLVAPSICYETFGLTVAEAMMNGLPVIASRIGALPELVEDGRTGFLVEPGNSWELANKMKELWDNEEMCRQMGRAGRRKALLYYSQEGYYSRLMDTYEKAGQIKRANVAI